MPTLYTVKQIATMLGISGATVRRMADDMADILPDYQPIAGQARKFTAADVQTLSALHTRLQASPPQTRSELLTELSRPDSEPLIIPDTLPTAKPQNAPGPPITSIAISEAIESISAQPNTHADTKRQLETLSARIETLSARDNQPAAEGPAERRFAVALALAFVLLLVGVTVSALLQSSQAALLASVLALLVIGIAMFWPMFRKR